MSDDLLDAGSDRLSQSDDEANNSANDQELTNENDENTESRRIDPATSRKRIVRNPIPKLNTARLRGPKGIHTIEKYFEGFKFNPKGNEKKDLDRIMKRLEHWAHRLFPKYQFDDFLEKVETLGAKRDLQIFLTKYRHDMLSDDEILSDIIGEIPVERVEQSPEPIDEFDLLIAEQIEKTKQVTMPQLTPLNSNISNINLESTTNGILTSNNQNSNTSALLSNDEIKKRIERNRQLAIERRLARSKRDEEIKRKKIVETSEVALNEISQISNVSQINNNISAIESKMICIEDTIDTINNKNSSAILNDDKKKDSNINEINSVRDKNNEFINNEKISNENIIKKPLLTDEELNKTIDDAVNQFMKAKRQLNER